MEVTELVGTRYVVQTKGRSPGRYRIEMFRYLPPHGIACRRPVDAAIYREVSDGNWKEVQSVNIWEQMSDDYAQDWVHAQGFTLL